MAMKIRQVRMGIDITDDSTPTFTDGKDWSENIINSDEIVKEIGIYGLPGTEFQINNSTTTVILNGSGLLTIGDEYNLITDLRISKTAEDLYSYTDTSGHCLIIDILYEEVNG